MSGQFYRISQGSSRQLRNSRFAFTPNYQIETIILAASRRVRALYYKLFLFKIYRTKQDAFYRSKVLNEVQFIEGQLDQISKTALLLLTRLSMALFTLILTTASMMVIDWFIIAAVYAALIQ